MNFCKFRSIFIYERITCSVDIIKALITEVNIHGAEDFEYIKEIFNVKASAVTYHLVTACGTYYDFKDDKHHIRSRNEAIVDIVRYAELLNESKRTKEEDDELHKLGDQGINHRYNERFPCRLWDLKKGMFLHGEPIVEIIEDSRIVITQDEDNSFNYHYVIPTYTYNAYQGSILI